MQLQRGRDDGTAEAARQKKMAVGAGLLGALLVAALVMGTDTAPIADEVVDVRGGAEPSVQAAGAADGAVPLDLYVMARCPDAHACVRQFAPAVARLGEAVAPRLHAIGRVEDSGAVTCPHGEAECLFNRRLLCAQDQGGAAQWYPFTVCMFERESPGLTACAARAGLEAEAVAECADGARGAELLRESVAGTERAGVKISCTARLAGRHFCEHNVLWAAGEPCAAGHPSEALRRAVCDAHRSPDPDVCSTTQ